MKQLLCIGHGLAGRSRRGAILLIVLWMLILAGLVGLAYSGSTRAQVDALEASRGRVEALWAARAGIERARVALENLDATTPLKADDKIFDDPETFANQPVGPARCSLVEPPTAPGGPVRYGLVDEATRVNINTASEEWIGKLPGITNQMRDCLLDWRDADDQARANGAEAADYAALANPIKPRNGPLLSLRELTRVIGWEPVWRLAYPDPYDRLTGGAGLERSTMPLADARKLLGMLTIWSADLAKAPDGQDKLALGDATAKQMRDRIGDMTEDEARAIEQWRRNSRFNQPTDLLDVTRPTRNGGNNGGGGSGGRGGNRNRGGGNNNNSNSNSNSNSGSGGGSGEKMFDLKRVGQIIDYFTASGSNDQGGGGQGGGSQGGGQGGGSQGGGNQGGGSQGGGAQAQPGRLNVNTVSRDVLMTVPDMTETLADGIIGARDASPMHGAGEIASVSGMDADAFRKLYPCLTAAATRFHAWSRGAEPASGAVVTVEAVLEAGDDGVAVVYWREE
jgi:type II secretory pathway component PulK